MSAVKKLKGEMSVKDIEELYYISIKDICLRTTYSRRTVEMAIQKGELKAEKKNNGKVVVKVSDFKHWWDSINT